MILYRRADIPGLGVFFIERTPAKLDVANKVFIAPISQIKFRAQTPVPDNRMYKFISCQEKEKVKRVFLVHGEYDVQTEFADKLTQKGFAVEIPGMNYATELST